jgi:hypothetical protein
MIKRIIKKLALRANTIRILTAAERAAILGGSDIAALQRTADWTNCTYCVQL